MDPVDPLSSPDRDRAPAPMVVAASIGAVQGLVLLLLAGAELANLSTERLALGTTTSAFFALFGLLLLACSWALTRTATWARGPLLLAQLIGLGLAWSFRGTWAVVVVLALSSGIAIAGLVHPETMRALGDEPHA
ncbi:MAG: hypothetical protein ABF306_11690 [Nocardioides marinisabuli]|uniref:hypothetical protein n=1 Tax=Nocardioides marinisabuli TaxID=419476 RepID=UPI0032197E6B